MKMDKVIGGEFAIDLNNFILHDNNTMSSTMLKIPYSSGRCALYMILRDIEEKRGKKSDILVPNYLCNSITNTIVDAGWNYIFYSVESDLYPNLEDILEHKTDSTDRIILLINYFGMIGLEQIVIKIKSLMPDVIIVIDNVQAFYEPKIDLADYTFTSYRKWFPCPDGAEVIKRNNENMLEVLFERNNIFSQYKFAGNLLKHFTAYLDDNISLQLLNEGESILDTEYLCRCSEITMAIFPTLDLKNIATLRKNNARILHEYLQKMNIPHVYKENSVPLFIPIFVENRDNVRKHFFKNKVFTPKHWPFINEKINGNSRLYNTELSLICDQRYNEEDMIFQINVLKQII